MDIKLDQRGLVPAIAQDVNTREVLMLGYVSPDSLRRTLDGGQVWFYSRSREELWQKGETSGNYMNLKSISVDCDGDTLLLQVEPVGPACHTGSATCFFTALDGEPGYEQVESGAGFLDQLYAVIQDRKRDMPEGSYTVELLRGGPARAGQKVVEEAGESAIAAVQGDADHVTREVADLFYHALVLLAASGSSPEAVWQELRQRHGG
jgi:phosphoribosyl-ATP pyrophosphohydrolase/phosphoribosyl-AMP cyclohydrolase